MFFPNRIISINENEKVLEIGPGATPYWRSDVFLELEFENLTDRIAQSGHVGILNTDKPIIYYDGSKFPFADKEFDYVICSHVLEHVPDVDNFLSEIQRVGKKGYFEFPTLYYDYIYNFPEHLNLILYKDGVINWMTKQESGLFANKLITDFFYRTCELGYHEMISDLKYYYFQGFEWFDKINSIHVDDIRLITYNENDIKSIPKKEFSPKEVSEKRTKIKKSFLNRLKRFF